MAKKRRTRAEIRALQLHVNQKWQDYMEIKRLEKLSAEERRMYESMMVYGKGKR